jgi:hypothetical protein
MTTPTLTIEQALALCAVLNGTSASKAPEPPRQVIGAIGRAVIVRSRDAGALFGEYQGNDGANVHLKSAVQMWQWFAAKGGTLVDCAVHGVRPDKCKFSVASATLTVFNACALIDCTDEGAASLRKIEGGSWK